MTSTTTLEPGAVIWLTGLPGAGKTTIAQALASYLIDGARHDVVCLDGDELRKRFAGTGFSKEARHQHVLRAARLAAEHERQGALVIVSLISPYSESRLEARQLIKRFIEVFVDTPLQVCEQRDPKGLYRLARSGQLHCFTGITDPYEPPEQPDVHLHTCYMSIADCVHLICRHLKERN